MSEDREKRRKYARKFGRKQVGQPFSTDRESVEEGEEREGTNLDLGEERSARQQEEIRRLDRADEG